MVSLPDSTSPSPRIRSDGMFIATFSVLGGTYVLLIILLLVGDLAYLLRAPGTTEAVITFDPLGNTSGSVEDEQIQRQLQPYGMSVESDATPRIFDSSNPKNKLWGSPHIDFGGPGTGVGGKGTGTYANDKQLGNILTPDLIDDSKPGFLRFRWEQPVAVTALQIFANTDPVDIRVLNQDHLTHQQRTASGGGPGSVHKITLPGHETDQVEIFFPEGGGLAGMRFSWPGRLRADWELRHPLLSNLVYNPVVEALSKPEIQYSIALSLISCTVTAIISLWIAVPLGYLLSRYSFFGKGLIDAILDIPIILPPLVVGLSLLILFQFMPVALRNAVVYQIPAVILAQVAVACAFAVRIMKAAFDQIDPRCEQVALTLGCGRASAFSRVVLPEALPGMLTAGTLAWARALGEFGPLLIFAGATRLKTEVLSTSVFLELSVGDLSAAVAISFIMIIAAILVLVLTRIWGTKTISL
jgi:molybdate transport system permease protein